MADPSDSIPPLPEDRDAGPDPDPRARGATGDPLPPPPAVRPDPKITFRSWLWLQHHEDTPFAVLARLVLGGGPENVWVNKPLKAEGVCYDVESFYGTKRGGITEEHVEMARDAIDAYKEDATSVGTLIDARRDTEAEAMRLIEIARADAMRKVAPGLEFEYPGMKPPGALGSPDGKPTIYGEGSVPRTLCNYITKRTTVCGRLAVLGQARCDLHGGVYLDPEETKHVVRAGTEKILSATTAAIETVIDIMQNSVQDAVRLKAAEMLLDRGGFTAGMKIEIEDGNKGSGGMSSADVIADRLARLAGHDVPIEEKKEPGIQPSEEIIEGTVVLSEVEVKSAQNLADEVLKAEAAEALEGEEAQ